VYCLHNDKDEAGNKVLKANVKLFSFFFEDLPQMVLLAIVIITDFRRDGSNAPRAALASYWLSCISSSWNVALALKSLDDDERFRAIKPVLEEDDENKKREGLFGNLIYPACLVLLGLSLSDLSYTVHAWESTAKFSWYIWENGVILYYIVAAYVKTL